MSNSEKDLEKIEKRAHKNLWITALLTFFIPFGGYIYTIRYTSAIIAFIAMIFLVSAEDVMDSDAADTLYGFFMLGTAIENVLSVNKSKQLNKDKGSKLGSNPYLALPNPKIEILKFGKERGELTLSDFVIATELPPERVKDILLELEKQDLVRAYNRDKDGAIVYRVI